MTKTLTEQWREGTLQEDCYYILTKNGHIKKDRTCFYSHTDEQCFCFTPNKDIEEVISAVPSYEKVKEMSQKIERLQEQLKEAREVVKFYANSQIGKKNKDGTCGFWLCSGDVAFDNPLERINNKMKYTCYDTRPAKKWLKKWGVK